MPNFIDLKNISKDQLIDLVSLSIKWKKPIRHGTFIHNLAAIPARVVAEVVAQSDRVSIIIHNDDEVSRLLFCD